MRDTKFAYLPLVTAIGCVALFGLLVLPFQNPTSLDDGIRHFTMAGLMAKNGIHAYQGWGDFFFTGYFTQVNFDPWYLTHVLLIPFAAFPLMTSIKLYIVLSVGLLVASFLTVLRPFKISPVTTSVLILLLFFGERLFLNRIFLARPFAIITSICLLSLHAILQRKWLLAFGLTAFATLFSHLFIFPMGILLSGACWIWSTGDRKNAYLIFLATICGVLSGILLHPESMSYAQYLFTVFLKPAFNKDLGVGAELYSGFGKGSYIMEPVLGVIILILMYQILVLKKSFKDLNNTGITFTFVLSCILLCFFYKWGRSIDFLWPMLLIAFGQALHMYQTTTSTAFRKQISKDFSKSARVVFYILTILLPFNVFRVTIPLYNINPKNDLAAYSDLSVIPTGSHVLNTDWWAFPIYFTVRPDLLYSSGMDPTFNYEFDPEGQRLLGVLKSDMIETENSVVDPARWLRNIRSRYDAQYIVFDAKWHTHFIEEFTNVPGVEKLSSSGAIGLFQILPE